jgi:hypothetical protein
MNAQLRKHGKGMPAKQTALPDKATRLIVYEVDAPRELHDAVEKYASKVRLDEGRKLNKSEAAAELLVEALKMAGFELL